MRFWFDRVNKRWEEKYSRLFIKPSDFTVFLTGLRLTDLDSDVEAEMQALPTDRRFAILKVIRIFGSEYTTICC